MTTLLETRPSIDDRRRDALAERLVASATGTLELFSIHLGRRLGLYAALDGSPSTYRDLAARTGIAPRYAEEWLEQQAVAGIVDVVTEVGGVAVETADGELRCYTLSRAHRAVLLEPDDAAHAGPLADMVAGIAGVLDRLAEAYRAGDGVPYSAYGEHFRRGQAGINRPLFTHDLPSWLAAIPDVTARLQCDTSGRVADVGCGEGFSTFGLAREFPLAAIDGYDLDDASIDAARRHLAARGGDQRVRFAVADAAHLTGSYDLIVVVEALHDFARPHEVLSGLRSALTDDGCVLVVDERVADSFTAPGDDVERLMYGWSVTHCLPASLAGAPSAALGTVLRSDTVRELAEWAGFRSCTELDIHHDFFRVYRLDR